MSEFGTVKEAKDFLAGRIAEEANRENVMLSEVERKMLYFSETDWTLPDMPQASADFDRDYDQDEYEKKVARLIANITADHHHDNEDEEEKWDAAVDKLSDGDHYIQVLIGETSHAGRPTKRDFLKAFVLIATLVALGVMISWLFGTDFWRERVVAASDGAKWLSAVLIILAGYFVVPRLWAGIRMRSDRG